ncbi:hypothetical protein [Kribbella endophytica]
MHPTPGRPGDAALGTSERVVRWKPARRLGRVLNDRLHRLPGVLNNLLHRLPGVLGDRLGGVLGLLAHRISWR